MSFTNLSALDVSYDDKAYGNLIDPYEWNQNFLKIEQIFNQNKQIIEENFNSVSSSNTPSEAIEELGQTLPSTVREQLLLIVNLLSTKASSDEVNSSISGLLKSAVLEESTGIVTFTKYDGSTFTIDFATEKIPAKFELVDSDGNVYLKITNIDGSFTQTDVTSLLNIYLFNNSSNIEFTVDGYNVTAKIKSGSIVKSDFSSDLISYFDDNVAAAAANALSAEASKLAAESAKNETISARDSALNSENNAKTYRDSSEQNYLLSKSYATGSTGIRANEDIDNAEYYMNQSKSYRDSVISAKDIAVAASENAKSSESKAEEYKNSTSLMKDEVTSMLSETQTAKDGAVAAKTSAEAARDESVSAKDEAVTAKEYSVAAKEAAETAKNSAEQAKEDSIAAKTAAETARDQAQEIAGGDYATKTELTQGLSTKSNHTLIIIPAGRMRGDVDGDGNIDDANALMNSKYYNTKIDQTNIDAMACDINGDGFCNSSDLNVLLTQFKDGKFPEVTGNWTNNPNYATEDGKFYTDIPVTGMTANHSASVIVKGTFENGFFTNAECIDGAIRIYAKLCPISEVMAVVEWGTGDGTAVITTESEDLTAYAEHISNADIHVTADEKTAWNEKANKPTISTSTISASAWSDGVYSFEADFPVATYDIEVEIDGDSCTTEQLKAWNSAQIVGSSTTNSCKALGDVPAIDIPIIIKVVKK